MVRGNNCFSGKPAAIVTASASGIKAHESLQLGMKTVGAVFLAETTLLIQGVRSKIDEAGTITDIETQASVQSLTKALIRLIADS